MAGEDHETGRQDQIHASITFLLDVMIEPSGRRANYIEESNTNTS